MDIHHRDFAIEPIGFRFGSGAKNGYVSLNAKLSEQSDRELIQFTIQLQEQIVQRCAEVGLPILEHTGEQRPGLYVYPDHTLHCTFFDDAALRQPSYEAVASLKVDVHPWLDTSSCILQKFEVIPRWFFAYDPAHPALTEGFSLQLFIARATSDQLTQCFGSPSSFGNAAQRQPSRPVSKLYPASTGGFVRGVINVARLLAREAEEVIPDEQQLALRHLLAELNQQTPHRACWIDKLFVVKSDAWLSASETIREIKLQ